MKVRNPLADTFCLMVGMCPARQRRPGEQFEVTSDTRSIDWRRVVALAALVIVISMVSMMAR